MQSGFQVRSAVWPPAPGTPAAPSASEVKLFVAACPPGDVGVATAEMSRGHSLVCALTAHADAWTQQTPPLDVQPVSLPPQNEEVTSVVQRIRGMCPDCPPDVASVSISYLPSLGSALRDFPRRVLALISLSVLISAGALYVAILQLRASYPAVPPSLLLEEPMAVPGQYAPLSPCETRRVGLILRAVRTTAPQGWESLLVGVDSDGEVVQYLLEKEAGVGWRLEKPGTQTLILATGPSGQIRDLMSDASGLETAFGVPPPPSGKSLVFWNGEGIDVEHCTGGKGPVALQDLPVAWAVSVRDRLRSRYPSLRFVGTSFGVDP